MKKTTGLRIICLLILGLLTSCVISTDHFFSGNNKIDQKGHWIELRASQLLRSDGDTWYALSGPGPNGGMDGANAFTFLVGLPSFQQPPPFEVIRLEILYNHHSPPKFSRLLKLEEREMQMWNASYRYEIWVPLQPSPSAGAPELQEGTYHIKVHYRLGGEEFDAEWECAYKTKTLIERWHRPTCQTGIDWNA